MVKSGTPQCFRILVPGRGLDSRLQAMCWLHPPHSDIKRRQMVGRCHDDRHYGNSLGRAADSWLAMYLGIRSRFGQLRDLRGASGDRRA
jgi:hypothetical protein